MPHTLTVTVPDACRWITLFTPNPEKPGEGHVRFSILAGDVTTSEIALVASGLVSDLIRSGHQRFPTDAEQEAARQRQRVMEENPATQILGRDGAQVWIGDAAVEAGILTRLVAIGWTDCGRVEVKGRACDWALEPEAFEAKHLPTPAEPVENGATESQ